MVLKYIWLKWWILTVFFLNSYKLIKKCSQKQNEDWNHIVMLLIWQASCVTAACLHESSFDLFVQTYKSEQTKVCQMVCFVCQRCCLGWDRWPQRCQVQKQPGHNMFAFEKGLSRVIFISGPLIHCCKHSSSNLSICCKLLSIFSENVTPLMS